MPSFPTNAKSFAKAKTYLEEALCKAAGDILAEGEAGRVYDLAFQLFPLTRESAPAVVSESQKK